MARTFEAGFVENIQALDFSELFERRAQHSMMFIRLEAWGVLWLLAGAVVALLASA